jgi:hypothetical protein
LSPLLAANERRTRGDIQESHAEDKSINERVSSLSRTIEAGLLAQRESDAPSAQIGTHQSSTMRGGLHGTKDRRTRFSRLPVEYYLNMVVLLIAMPVLVLSRRWSSSSGSKNQVSSGVPVSRGQPLSPTAPGSRDQAGTAASGNARGQVGTIAAMIGLTIAALGIARLVHGHIAGQLASQRPAMLMAAVGQGILLLGITAQLVHRAGRGSRAKSAAESNNASAANPSRGAWPGMVPVPMNGGYAGHHSGQVAQLKAQLACLSQQLDQLVISESATQKRQDYYG